METYTCMGSMDIQVVTKLYVYFMDNNQFNNWLVGRVWGYSTHIWHPPPKKHYFPKHYFPKHYEHHGYDGYGHGNNGYGHGSYGHGYQHGLGHKIPYSLGHFGHGKSLGHGYEHGLGHGGYGLNHKGYGHNIKHGYGHETHGKGHNHGYNGGGFADLGFPGKFIWIKVVETRIYQ